MAANKCIAGVFHGIAQILGYACFGMGIASLSSLEWITYSGGRQGLFRFCISGVNRCSNLGGTAWLNAVRAFVILMVIFSSCGSSAGTASSCNQKKSTRKISTVLLVIAGVFGIVGCAVYTGEAQDFTGAFDYGYGFILAWCSCGCVLVGAVFQAISTAKMVDGKTCNDSSVEGGQEREPTNEQAQYNNENYGNY